MRVRVFSLSRYVEEALKRAEYAQDEDGLVVAAVPRASGFYAQGEHVEEARANLRDVIETNVVLALQLGFDIPRIPGVAIQEQEVPMRKAVRGKTDSAPIARRRA
jgi:predicted RNase H-like HicB family nuclease